MRRTQDSIRTWPAARRLLAVLGLFVAGAASAGGPPALRARPADPPSVRSFDVHSARLGRDYVVSVAVPKAYAEQPERRYPVLFVTDANFFFPVVHAIWQMLDGAIDTPILVGIGPPPDAPRDDILRRRVHEFSPPDWNLSDPFGQEILRLIPECRPTRAGAVARCTGGAPVLLSFITDELLPAIGGEYRVDANDLGLFGDSAGGFFASWVLLQGDTRFRHFILGSPVMAYGGGSIFALEERYAETHRDLPAAVYLASGVLEQLDREVELLGRVVSGSAHFAASVTARGYPQLHLLSETHRDLDHGTVVPLLTLRGLEFTYRRAPDPERP